MTRHAKTAGLGYTLLRREDVDDGGLLPGRARLNRSGAKRQVRTTLMSAFPSSRRVNWWLHWKRLHRALAGKAGGTVVMTTVDHPLMRGAKPPDRWCGRG